MTPRHGRWALLALLVLTGCGHNAAPPYENWGAKAQQLAPQGTEASAAFQVLAEAAQSAEKKAPESVQQTTFSPPMQKALKTALEPEVAQVRKAVAGSVTFPNAPRSPFQPAKNQSGWRMIGRVLVWTEQGAAANKDFDKAISNALDASAFGFSLTAGDVTDASLGLVIADEARVPLAENLEAMSAGQLERLADGMEGALLKRPTLLGTFKNERQNMLLAVQAVQDAYSAGKLDELNKQLGNSAHDGVSILENMRADGDAKRPAFFEGLAAEANTEADYLEKACLQPLRKREAPVYVKSKKRPWHQFNEMLFRAGRPLLAMNDVTLARTRLLILTARLIAKSKRSEALPETLAKVNPRIAQDPFSGRTFVYHPQGSRFRIYSVGLDGRDDGGETDHETYLSPDLTLEGFAN